MSEIKLKKESMESEFPGVTPDIDENNVPFNRLTFTVKHPISKEVTYYELNKNDSKSLLTEKKDGVYGNQEDVDYLKDNWCVSEYVSSLSLAWRPAEKDVDIPDEWWEEVNIVPQRTAMYDDVFVNQEIVKKDYAVGCTGKLKTEYDELIAKA